MRPRPHEVTAAYRSRRTPLETALTNSESTVLKKPLMKAILATDVCAQTYLDCVKTLGVATDEFHRSVTHLPHEEDRALDSLRAAHSANPGESVMSKAAVAMAVLQHDTLVKALTLRVDFLRYLQVVADETALAVLTPPEPRLVKAVLEVAWDKLVEAPLDTAALFVTAVIRKLREQLPNSTAADSYLMQLEQYEESGHQAIFLMELLRQILLFRTSGQKGSVVDLQSLEPLINRAIKERSEEMVRTWQERS